MPCRYIREEYLTSERVDALDVNAERFYFRLFLVVDDYGRYDANERLLKSRVYPLKDEIRTTDIARFLTACEKADLITLYTVAGKPYLEIKRFSQTRANCRSGRSKYPPPPTVGNNLQANANNLQAFAAENENDNESENESEWEKRASAPAPAPVKPPVSFPELEYPKSALEVLALAEKIGCAMMKAQAEAYFNDRTVKDWHMGAGGEGRLIRPENVPADIRRWVDRDRTEERRRMSPTGRIAADSAEIQPDNVL